MFVDAPGVLQEEQYADWVSACRLGARGRSLADAAFHSEASAVRALLALQTPRPAAAGHSLPHLDHLAPHHYLAPRFLKKLKSKVRLSFLSFYKPLF